MASIPNPLQNRLLASLPADAYGRLCGGLELVRRPLGATL